MLYRDKKPLIFFLLPSLLLMLVLLYYPFIENIVNSFFEIRSLGSPREEFIGLHNYAKFFAGDETAFISCKASVSSAKAVISAAYSPNGLSAITFSQHSLAVMLPSAMEEMQPSSHASRASLVMLSWNGLSM